MQLVALLQMKLPGQFPELVAQVPAPSQVCVVSVEPEQEAAPQLVPLAG